MIFMILFFFYLKNTFLPSDFPQPYYTYYTAYTYYTEHSILIGQSKYYVVSYFCIMTAKLYICRYDNRFPT